MMETIKVMVAGSALMKMTRMGRDSASDSISAAAADSMPAALSNRSTSVKSACNFESTAAVGTLRGAMQALGVEGLGIAVRVAVNLVREEDLIDDGDAEHRRPEDAEDNVVRRQIRCRRSRRGAHGIGCRGQEEEKQGDGDVKLHLELDRRRKVAAIHDPPQRCPPLYIPWHGEVQAREARHGPCLITRRGRAPADLDHAGGIYEVEKPLRHE